MEHTPQPYAERFPVGTRVRVVSRDTLQAFATDWLYHHPLELAQIEFANIHATVERVGFYHGGDVLYWLRGIPGVWHESCLESLDPLGVLGVCTCACHEAHSLVVHPVPCCEHPAVLRRDGAGR